MENDEKAGMAPDAGMATPRQTATAAEAHPKPMLTVEQQIAHMKTKGITFNLVSEGEAAAHLARSASSSASTPTASSSPSTSAARGTASMWVSTSETTKSSPTSTESFVTRSCP